MKKYKKDLKLVLLMTDFKIGAKPVRLSHLIIYWIAIKNLTKEEDFK